MKNFLLYCLLLSTGVVLAQNPNLGASGAKFLNIPVGARAAAMGGAVIGSIRDASSVFWNPAGISHIENEAVHFSSVDLYSQFQFSAVSIVHNAGDFGVIAASFLSLSMEKTEITTELLPNGTGRYYDANDIAIGISYGRKLSNEFSVGVTAKYINQRIWNEVADGVSFDIGTQYSVDFNNLVIAMSMTNFGSDLKFDGEDLNITKLRNDNYPISRLAPGRLETGEFPIPLHFQVGVGIDLLKQDFVTVRGELDATHPNDSNERINGGVEFNFFERLFLRGGYRYRYDDETFTVGAGFNFQVGDGIVHFDYAFSNFTLLPDLHRYSVGIDF